MSVSSESDYVAIGAFIKPHGVRGELRVYAYNPDSSIWKKLKTVRLVLPGGPEERSVLRAKKAAKYVVMAIEGCRSMEEADALRRVELEILRADFPDLQGNEYYYADLPGMQVHDEDNNPLGEALGVLEYPAVDCLEVRGVDGGVREVPLMRPWLRDVDEVGRVVRVQDWDDLPVRSG